MRRLQASKLKATCLAVLDDVARTGEGVTILKRGKPVAELLPAVPRDAGYPQNRLRGTVKILGDVLEPVLAADTWEAERPPRAKTRRARRR